MFSLGRAKSKWLTTIASVSLYIGTRVFQNGVSLHSEIVRRGYLAGRWCNAEGNFLFPRPRRLISCVGDYLCLFRGISEKFDTTNFKCFLHILLSPSKKNKTWENWNLFCCHLCFLEFWLQLQLMRRYACGNGF